MKHTNLVRLRAFFIGLLGLFLLVSCDQSYTPKPRGYLRIDLPQHSYKTFDEAENFSFEVPDYAVVETDKSRPDAYDWYTIQFPAMKASLHLSYKSVHNDLPRFLEDAHTMAFKHLPKASGIADSVFFIPEHQVEGLFYLISGKGVASPVQFYLTDSTQHFVRGALYFNFLPNNDSIAPVIQHLKIDINHLVSTFKWKHNRN